MLREKQLRNILHRQTIISEELLYNETETFSPKHSMAKSYWKTATGARWSILWEVVELIPTKEEWDQALAERHGEVIQKSFASATVAVYGLRGLGSHLALALAGIRNLILIDFDHVEYHKSSPAAI